jgi:hypothetical protein
MHLSAKLMLILIQYVYKDQQEKGVSTAGHQSQRTNHRRAFVMIIYINDSKYEIIETCKGY